METIVFYGAGMLGSGFVRAFRRRGVAVHVWNRTFEKAQALEACGAVAFRSAAEAARGVTRVHLCLRDDTAVDETFAAARPGIAPKTPIVDHTTVTPRGVLDRAKRLHDAGYTFLHAPVFMGPPQAEQATGTMLASGPKGDFDALHPSLAPMTGEVRYLGARVDLASIFKLMGNAMILAVVGGLNDVFSLAEACGVTREEAYTLFDFYHPEGQITGRGKRMSQADYEPTWTLEMAHKDATLMLQTANDRSLPIIAAIESRLRYAIERGFGDQDLAAIAKS